MPPSYQIEFSKKAARQFKKLARPVQIRLSKKIDGLIPNPRPPGAKKLTGQEEIYRIRVGDYRILYEIEEERLIILIVEIGHRREIYRLF